MRCTRRSIARTGRPCEEGDMKAVVAYGSSRGTTARVAEVIANGMTEGGVAAVAISVEYLTPSRAASADILGIGSPVHFYRESRYVTNFLSTLPRLESKRAFVFCTCGMDRPGETLSRLHGSLAARGASVVGAERFRSAMSYFPLRQRGLGNGPHLPDDAVLEAAHRFGKRMAGAKDLAPVEAPPVSMLTALKAGLLANMKFRRRIFPGIRLNTSVCTGYGQCMSRCLVNGLARKDEEDTVPSVTDTCVQCLECIAWCPRGAIVVDSPFREWMATVNYRLGIH